MNDLDKKIVIIYHGDCPDGFGAAWAAWKKFGKKAIYFGMHHGDPTPKLINKEIYLLDFTYQEEIIKKLIEANKRVTAIDHHISREKEIKLTKDYRYSLDNSGSVLAWKYFHPKKPIPKFLKFIEDRDLWKFKLKNTREACYFVDTFDFDFSLWNKLAGYFENKKTLKKCIESGKVIIKFVKREVIRLIENNADPVVFEGHETLAVNGPHFLSSQIGSLVSTKLKPPIAIIWSQGKDGINFSLRSDGSVDVSKIAQKFGGGGHKAASGFNLPIGSSFPWKRIHKK